MTQGMPTDPNSNPSDAAEIDASTQACQATGTLKSIHIDVGWTFSRGLPSGTYELQVGGQTFSGQLNNGEIRIDTQLPCITGNGSLAITITNGPTFRAEVILDLPPVQTPAGLVRRLTNLGFYAGTDGVFDGRARWAIRAFKRAKMNSFQRNTVEIENDGVTPPFLTAITAAYGLHSGDVTTGAVAVGAVQRDSTRCGMFGSRNYRRDSFETTNGIDDADPADGGNGGRWQGASAAGMPEPIAGTFRLYLRGFDPAAGESRIRNRVNLPQPIHMAQFALFEMGYRVIKTFESATTRDNFTPNGTFDRNTQWAVREFQIYAKMEHCAREDVSRQTAAYLDRLSRESTGARRYSGPVSGVLNQATRDTMQAWVDAQWRCPVVIQARTGRGFADIYEHADNVWLHNDVTSSAPRFFARDFTQYYTFPNGRNRNAMIVVGDWQPYLSWTGGRSVPPNHTWRPEGELLPDSLTGLALAAMGNATRSTYKVIRAVSEIECMGYFDSLNTYDNAFMSLGPCHWTLGVIQNGQVSEGELCGYFAYLRRTNQAAFESSIGFFGMRTDEDWGTDGATLYSAGARKYVGWVALQDEAGNFRRLPLDEGEANYFKTWHWFYRLEMAGRTIEGYRRGMWAMARIRVRDIRAVPWGTGVANVGTQAATIGSVFTSEKATAILLRWHIRYPGHVIANGHASARLRTALANAQAATPNLTWTGSPTTWTDAHEAVLVAALRAAASNAGGNLANAVTYLNQYPQWATGQNLNAFTLDNTIGGLSEARNSFTLDSNGLPPAPP